MKFSARGHDYSIEWLATCAGLFLACTWLLILLVIKAGDVGAKDFISVAAFFGIGFSTMELIGAREIFWLWHEENDALREEAWLRYWDARMKWQNLRDGKQPPQIENQSTETPRQITIHQGGETRTIDAERNLTAEEWALGNALQSILLWAWHTGDITSGALVGKGKPISEAEDWQHLTDRLSEMGFVRKGNGVKTEMVTTYAQAVGSVFDRLSMVSTKDGHKAKVAPPPQDAWKKSRSSTPKA